ncbi:MAG TPA: DsbE family thiol:disulfide interchange protein [Rhodanobacteraceae bacterium]|nr:DsbE family thiol:disulfide interchange protein [Rhodanobacteraceae bacterium]
MGRILPLAGFAVLVALFGFGIWWNTDHATNYVPSPLVGKAAPAFDLPRLQQPEQRVAKSDLLGHAYLLNVFASWCFACGEEHPVLMAHRGSLGVPLIGYNYKDVPDDARAWLARHGNPYSEVIVDRSGRTAIDFGIYGAPETFLVDAGGIIRYKHIGPLTPDIIADELMPAIAAARGAR